MEKVLDEIANILAEAIKKGHQFFIFVIILGIVILFLTIIEIIHKLIDKL